MIFRARPGTQKGYQRPDCRGSETAAQQLGSQPQSTENDLAPLSLPVISRIANVEPGGLSLSANLADDLKLDSLGRVELLSALEDQYQIELDEAAITEATTIADIERIVSRGKSEAVRLSVPALGHALSDDVDPPRCLSRVSLAVDADHVSRSRDWCRTIRESEADRCCSFPIMSLTSMRR